ncbi:MAG: ACT domain-containing protein [Christensenellales bacterium]|jgi:hypothetical protein
MFVKQVSVFIENKKGRLAALTKLLSDNNIDLIALSIADTTNFGILRCIVNDTAAALDALRAAGFTASTTDVLAVEVPDKPGGLAEVLSIIDKADISVEYLYSFVRTQNDNALIIFRMEDTRGALEVLKKSGVTMLSQEQVVAL